MLPSVRVSEPATVSVVPAATRRSCRAVEGRRRSALWLPVIVWAAANTTSEVPGSSGARGVRPVVGGPDRAGQGERARGLVDDRAFGRLPAAVVDGSGQRLGAGAVDEQRAAVRRRTSRTWLIGALAATVPVLRVPSVRVTAPPRVRVVPAAIVCRGRVEVDVVERVAAGDRRPPANTTSEVPGSSGARGVRPVARVVRIVPARVSVPEGLSIRAPAGCRLAVVDGPGQRLGAGTVDEQRAAAAAVPEDLADRRPGPRPCRC